MADSIIQINCFKQKIFCFDIFLFLLTCLTSILLIASVKSSKYLQSVQFPFKISATSSRTISSKVRRLLSKDFGKLTIVNNLSNILQQFSKVIRWVEAADFPLVYIFLTYAQTLQENLCSSFQCSVYLVLWRLILWSSCICNTYIYPC